MRHRLCELPRPPYLQAAGTAEVLRRENGTLTNTRRRVIQRELEIRRRDFILALRDRPCQECGGRFPPFILQFDHRDASTKKFVISQTWMSSEARILKEAAKCDIVCPNCHRDRTFRRRLPQAGVV